MSKTSELSKDIAITHVVKHLLKLLYDVKLHEVASEFFSNYLPRIYSRLLHLLNNDWRSEPLVQKLLNVVTRVNQREDLQLPGKWGFLIEVGFKTIKNIYVTTSIRVCLEDDVFAKFNPRSFSHEDYTICVKISEFNGNGVYREKFVYEMKYLALCDDIHKATVKHVKYLELFINSFKDLNVNDLTYFINIELFKDVDTVGAIPCGNIFKIQKIVSTTCSSSNDVEFVNFCRLFINEVAKFFTPIADILNNVEEREVVKHVEEHLNNVYNVVKDFVNRGLIKISRLGTDQYLSIVSTDNKIEELLNTLGIRPSVSNVLKLFEDGYFIAKNLLVLEDKEIPLNTLVTYAKLINVLKIVTQIFFPFSS